MGHFSVLRLTVGVNESLQIVRTKLENLIVSLFQIWGLMVCIMMHCSDLMRMVRLRLWLHRKEAKLTERTGDG